MLRTVLIVLLLLALLGGGFGFGHVGYWAFGPSSLLLVILLVVLLT